MQKRAVRAAIDGPAGSAYRERGHAVGVLAFDESANVETVSEHLSTFLHAFCPVEGLMVRAARGSKREVLPARFTQTSSVSARQLARGGSLELSQRHLDPVDGRCVSPLFWIASRGVAERDDDDEEAPPALQFGVCIARPKTEGAELAIAHALRTFFEACVELEGCISAVLTAQGPPLALASPALAYEELAGTLLPAKGRSVGWLRSHVRSPGWLVLIPRGVARGLTKTAPEGVVSERVRGGLLAQLDAPTPFATTTMEAMERWLGPILS